MLLASLKAVSPPVRVQTRGEEICLRADKSMQSTTTVTHAYRASRTTLAGSWVHIVRRFESAVDLEDSFKRMVASLRGMAHTEPFI